MPSRRMLSLLAVAALGACDSKVTSVIDTDLQAKVETLQDCFPGLYAWVQELLDVAKTWKLNTTSSAPDPVGSAAPTIDPDGSVAMAVVRGATTIAVRVRFYGPTGDQPDPMVLTAAMAGATTLGDAVAAAVAELRGLYGPGDPFLVAEWSISGGGISAAGEGLTGIVSGTSPAKLKELRTTEVAVVAPNGVPAVDSSTITDSGPPVCSLTFRTASLITDEDTDQQYPRGDVALTVVGPEATVDATITFDKTSTARVVVAGVPGAFAFDIAARSLVYEP